MAFDILAGIKSAVVGPLSRILAQIRTTIDTAVHIVDVMHQTVDDAIGIYHEIQTFELKPHWHTRALSVPDAVQNVKDLVETPTKIFIAVRDLVSRVKASVQQFKSPVGEAEAAAAEASSLEGSFIRLFPRLATLIGRAATRILGAVALVVQLAVDVDNAINDIHTLVGQLRVGLESLNHLDAVFLRQNKKRQTLKLADGGTIRVRVPRRGARGSP